MTTRTNDSRRNFLIGTAASAVAAIVPMAGNASDLAPAGAPARSAHLALPETQVFAVKLFGDLRELPAELQLIPGQLSDPIALKGNDTYRVRITPTDMASRFGPIYSLVLADANGTPLEQMNIGSDTTAIFTRHGVQVYALSIEQAV